MLKNILTVLRKLASAAMNFLIVYFETIAVPMSWAMGGTIMFTMYTELSNIFNGAVCSCWWVCGSWAASSPGWELPLWLKRLKFISTSCLAMTLLTVVIILAPMYEDGNGWYIMLFTGSMLYHHFLNPVLAILSLYSSVMPAFSQVLRVASSQTGETCTSPMWALPSSSMHRRVWPMPPPMVRAARRSAASCGRAARGGLRSPRSSAGGICVDADAHAGDFQRMPSGFVPEEDIAVQLPVVIVGGAAVVGLAALSLPPICIMKTTCSLHDGVLALLRGAGRGSGPRAPAS